jgi:hypothetical protein
MKLQTNFVLESKTRSARPARAWWLGGLMVLALAGGVRADNAPLPPIDPSAVRVPAPNGIALDRAERRFADAYEVELADKTDAGRRKLIQAILNDAPQTRDDPSGRYVMLREARKIALTLNDTFTADYLGHQIELLYALFSSGTPSPAADAVPSTGLLKTRARLPVPSETAYGEARKKLKAKYATYYANTTALVRSSLLGKLLLDVDGASAAADQYAALREAAEVAIAIGDIKTAEQCNVTLASIYHVEETDLRLAMLVAGAAQMGKAIPAHDLALADLNLADDAIKADNYEAAVRALTLATSALPGAADEALTIRHKKREKEIREMRDEYQRVAVAIKKVADNPNDADSNLKAGRFYCLIAGNWKKGIPMLLKGSDIAMKLLAEAEMAGANSTDGQVKIADGWWDKSASESGASAIHCKARAGYWYRRAKTSNAAALPDRVTTRLLTTTGSIDLMALMTSHDRVSGQWTGTPQRLTCSNAGVSRLQFPHAVPEEFDFAVQFTTHKTGDNVVQIIPTHDTYFAWAMGNGHTGFETLDPNAPRPVYNHFPFAANKAYLSVVEVRKAGVRVIINGTLVAEWKTNFADFTAPPNWKLGDPKMLGFGSAFTEVTIQSARLIDLSTEGE